MPTLKILDRHTKKCWKTWQMPVPWPKFQFYLFLIWNISLQLKQLATDEFIVLWRAVSGWMWFSAFVFNEPQSLDIFKEVFYSEYPPLSLYFVRKVLTWIYVISSKRHCYYVAYNFFIHIYCGVHSYCGFHHICLLVLFPFFTTHFSKSSTTKLFQNKFNLPWFFW